LQFLLEVSNITSKATNYTAFVINVPDFVSSSPTIAYILDCILIKLCQLSICLYFFTKRANFKEAGLISIDAGLISREAGLISREAGLLSIEDGLISVEAGLISIETSGEHDVIFQVQRLQFLLEVSNITSKATNYTAFVINVPDFVSSSPTIAYIFDCILIKLCQLSICLYFFTKRASSCQLPP
jgi:hypothetical protein